MKLKFEQLLGWYLRRRGWVVFWLDDWTCSAADPQKVCWLAVYAASERKKGRP